MEQSEVKCNHINMFSPISNVHVYKYTSSVDV